MVLLGPQLEVGIDQEDMVLFRLGILHNNHNSHHISVLALEVVGGRNLADYLQWRAAAVDLRELAVELQVALVLEAREDTEQEDSPLQQTRVALLLVELDTDCVQAAPH